MTFFMTMVGWIGMAGFALCHLLLSYRVLKVGIPYQVLQITFAICLGISAFWDGFYPSTGLEIFWATISVASIRRYWRERRARQVLQVASAG